MKKRFLGILLSFALMLTMMPVLGLSLTAMAWDGNPYTSLVDTTTPVHFDGKDWYLIKDESTAIDAGTVTLLSKECVGASKFGSNNIYSGSTVESYVNNWYEENISPDAKTAVSGNAMFLLTKEQANAITNAEVRKCSNASNDGWWLGEQGALDTYAACVSSVTGDVIGDGADVSLVGGVRPALKLDLSKVVFDSSKKTFSVITPYPLWVGGIQVTSANAADVFAGTADAGKVSFTPATDNTPAILSLNNYVYEGIGHTGQGWNTNISAPIYWDDDNTLIINLNGENSVITTEADDSMYCGIYSKGSLIFSGEDGKLNARAMKDGHGGSRYGIFSDGDVEINECDINAIGEDLFGIAASYDIMINSGTVVVSDKTQSGIYAFRGNIEINGGKVVATCSYDGIFADGNIVINDGEVTAAGNNGIRSSKKVVFNGGDVTSSGGEEKGINAYRSVSVADNLTVKAGDNEETAEDVTSTFVKNHDQKWVHIYADPVEYTVKFVVTNGSWDEGEGDAAKEEKTVTLKGKKGDTLKLTADQIPAVGNKPDTGYKAGSWDTVPSVDTPITENTTYTYTYAAREASDDVTDAINALPAGKDVKVSDKTAIEAARKAYDKLDDEQKSKVPAESLAKLETSEAFLNALESEAAAKAAQARAEADKKAAEEAAAQAGAESKAAKEAQAKAEASAKAAEEARAKAEADRKTAEDKAKAAEEAKARAEAAQKAAEERAAEAEKNALAPLDQTVLAKTKGAKKKVTVRWKAVSGAEGYQIVVAKNKKGTKKAKTYTVKGASKVKKVVKKLKKGKYYVKVRAYKTYKGNTVYGKFSKVKRVKVR